MKEGFAHSSAFQASSGIESQPAAIMSASAVLPEPRAPMIATRPGLSDMVYVFIHGASRTSIPAITCEGVADTGGSLPTCARSPGSIHACGSADRKSDGEGQGGAVGDGLGGRGFLKKQKKR